MNRRLLHFHPGIGIAIATLAVWGVVLTFGFVWDDFPMIANNSSLHRWSTLWSGWFHDFWMLHDSPQVSGYWRPLPTMVHVVLTKLTGGSAWIFHFLNLTLHFLTTYFFYRFLVHTRLVRWFWIPVLFFLWHPLAAETVSFNSAIPDLLSAMFGWAAISTWTHPKTDPRKKLIWTCVFLGLSFLSKESGVFFGIFIIGMDLILNRTQTQKKNMFWCWIVMLMMIVYVLLHLAITKSIGSRDLWGNDLFTHSATVFKLFGYQVFLVFVPIGSSPTRDLQLGAWNQWSVWVGLAMLISLLVLFFTFLNKRSSISFVIFFYLTFWFPVSNVIPAEGLITDRYMYMTSAAAALALGMLFSLYTQFPKIIALMLIGWGMWGLNQALVWKNSRTLWSHAVEFSPKSSVAWNEWGNVLASEKKYTDAIEAYDRAIHLRPQYKDASFNRVLSLYLAKDMEMNEAIEKHLRAFPQDPQAYDLLGSAYELNSEFEKAEEVSKKAVLLAPLEWKYRFNLASVYLQLRKYEEALIELREAHKLASDRYEVVKNLAATYCLNAQYKECIRAYEEFLRKFPNHAQEVRGPMDQAKQLLELTQGS